jgi:hypothetical protein
MLELSECPLWVKSGHCITSARCPLYGHASLPWQENYIAALASGPTAT